MDTLILTILWASSVAFSFTCGMYYKIKKGAKHKIKQDKETNDERKYRIEYDNFMTYTGDEQPPITD